MARSFPSLRRLPVLAGGLVVATCLFAGCRSGPVSAVDNRVGSGDAVQGQLVGFGDVQTFTFEGVESSLLDFALKSDSPHLSAPQVVIHDPEGIEVDVPLGVRSEAGSDDMQVKDLFLRRTGTYRVSVRSMTGAEPVFYRFSHRLRFPPQEPYTVRLTPSKVHEAVVSVPRGGRIEFRVWPARDSDVQPEIVAVLDPDGGRALDPAKRRRGMPVPVLHADSKHRNRLAFTAPKAGRYVIRTQAAEGTDGVARVAWTVQGPRRRARQVRHPNRDADYGMPAQRSGTAAARTR